MRPLLALTGALLTAAAATGITTTLTTTAAAASPASAVDVTVDRPQAAVAVGDTLTVTSQITNKDTAATDSIIANLNVASLTSNVYIDPEDWSTQRTRYLTSLAPGQSTTVSWELHAVNTGSFVVYIGLLPNGAASAGTGPLTVSPPVHVSVAGRRTLTAGGALPVAIAIPVLLGLAAGTIRYRLRRAD
jgi:hypothetical protein